MNDAGGTAAGAAAPPPRDQAELVERWAQLLAGTATASLEHSELGALVVGYVEALASGAEPVGGELFDSIALGIAVSGPDGRILRTNPALEELLGCSAEELLGHELSELFVPDAGIGLPEGYQRLLSGERLRLRFEAELRRGDGETTWTQAVVSVLPDATGAPRYLVTTVHDITELHLLKQQLNHQALHDVQTGLPNRQYFVSHLEMVLGRLDPSAVIILLHLDLDGFSVVNDGLGHRAGDRLLNVMARRLESVVTGRQAMVARLGGDEFAVLVEPGAAVPDIGALAETINDHLAQPADLDGVPVSVTASMGVVQQRAGECNPAELLRATSTTLARLRAKGRRQWALFDAEADAAHRTELRLAATLPGALADGELRVRYRPVVGLDTGLLVGAEAVLAWHHPRWGVLSQDRCMRLGERTGVVHTIGQRVLRTVAEQARAWHERHGADAPPVMLNLSLSQAQDPDLVAKVRSVLDRTGIAPAALELRVPVPAIRMVDGERSGPAGEEAEDNLRVLAELGVRTALHDFGGDIGALVCLTEPWVHAVRIAEAVSTQLADDPAGIPARALRALLPAMRDTGVSVLACAVDNARLAGQWRAMGADRGVGALFGEPRRARDIERMFGTRFDHLI